MSSTSNLNGRSMSIQSKYRKWEKVIQPLVQFDRKSSSFSLPIEMMNELQRIINKNIPLHLNIPLTLTGVHDHCLKTIFKTDDELIGMVTFTPNIVKSAFDYEIEKQLQRKVQKLSERQTQFRLFIQQKISNNTLSQMVPFIVLKEIIKPTDSLASIQSRSLILSKDEYKKILHIDSNQILQSFIYGNASTASMTRYFCFPKKDNLSIAYKIDNNESPLKKRFVKDLWRIEIENHHSFTFIKVMHLNKSFHKQTMNLVKALQTSAKITVQKIVCDWIIDSQNRYVLLDVKQIKSRTPKLVEKPLTDLKSMLAVLTCTVCQERFPTGEINKLVTYKLIAEFFEHLKKRKVHLSFKPNYNKSSSATAKICDLCYMLVVSESKLIQLEKTMARITNSIQRDQDQTSRMLPQIKQRDNRSLNYQENYLTELYCWRLFFYLQDIKELASLYQEFEKYNQHSHYFIMIKLHDSITSFKLASPKSNDNLSIKGIKVTYLFSQTEKIDKFLNKSQITIRLTDQNNWNAVIAEGSTSSLYHESQKFSMRKYKQILLFNSSSKYCVLGIHLAIKLDGLYYTQKLALDKIYDVYMTNQNFTNCLPLPPEWMEIIDPIYQFDHDQHKKFQYELNMPSKQFKSLLPSIKSNNKKKLIL